MPRPPVITKAEIVAAQVEGASKRVVQLANPVEFRCSGADLIHEKRRGRPCRKLLAKMELKPGSKVEIQCPNCFHVNRIEMAG